MKFKRTFFLTAVVVAIGLLLGAGPACATEVVFGDLDAPTKATRILDLDIEGTLYDVTFNLLVTAAEIYGPYPGEFPFFNRRLAAGAARDAVNVALLEAGATAVGDEASDAKSTIFNIGFKSKILRIGSLKAVKVARGAREGTTWNSLGFNAWAYNVDQKTYAEFTLASDREPDPVAIGGTVTGLTGEGLILQNNGADDLAIEANDIDFEFATPLTLGESYNVTVFTDPAGQTCSVEDGSGVVTDGPVTDIVVSCVDEPDDPGEEATILETLRNQDGAQVFAAAIQAAEERCPRFSRLLDRKRANLVVLVPPNEGFEVFLNLIPGTFKAWDVDSIERMLPGILEASGMKIRDLCRLLRRHISKGERGEDPITLQELLQRGTITMLDGSEYPVAIGGGRGGGACINYEACIVEPDVFTANGVIHYLHKVLERPPVEEPEPPPDSDDDSDGIEAWCSQGACADPDNEAMKEECIDFLGPCLASAEKEGDREGCAAAALFMCTEREGLFGGDGIFD